MARPLLLWTAAALALRVAFLAVTDESWADAYAHMEIAADYAASWRDGTFSVAHIAGLWLPLFHVLCGALLVVFPFPLWVGRIVSLVAGAALAPIGFASARVAASSSRIAPHVAAFAAATAPVAVAFSAYAMTEALFAALLGLALLFLLRAERSNRFYLGACAALAAAMATRLEAWPVAVVAALAAPLQRRAHPGVWLAGVALLALPVAGWLGLHAAVHGDPLHFTRLQRTYLEGFYEQRPGQDARGPAEWGAFAGSLFRGAGPGALFALGALALARRGNADRRTARLLWAWTAAHLGFLAATYSAGLSAAFARYMAPLVPPVALLSALALARAPRPRLVLPTAIVAMLAASAGPLWSEHRKERLQAPHREAGRFLRDHSPPGLVLCDEPGVRLVSGLPRSRFVSASEVPLDVEALRARGVRTIVWSGSDYARFWREWPELAPGPERHGPLQRLYAPPANDAIRGRAGLSPIWIYGLE